MKGFFQTEKKTNKKAATRKAAGSKQLSGNSCESCGLYKTCISPKMPVTGKGRKKILIIAEAPGKSEDEQSTQLVGEAGKTLRAVLEKYDVNIDEDCWKTNAVICRPPKNATPTARQIVCCHHNLEKTIQELQPEKIILLGKIALQSFLLGRESVSSIDKWTGYAIPDQQYKCWVFPTWHPQYLNYNKDNKVLHKLFSKHIKQAVEWEKEWTECIPHVRYITDVREAIDYLCFFNNKYAAIDFETTGLKPYMEGHKILCIAISSKSGTVAMPMFDHWEFIPALCNFLSSPCRKIGHNIKYETVWAKTLLGANIFWYADTMIDAHCRDNRRGVSGLKFQTYVNFGIIGYDKEAKKYISSGSGNDFNNMESMPQEQMLEYCGLDAYFTYRLFRKYKTRDEASQFFFKGQLALAAVEMNGIYVDKQYYHSQFELLQRRMDKLQEKIMTGPEVAKWNERFKEPFNFNSNKQLEVMLFSILGHAASKKTKKDNNSTDAEVLASIDSDFTNKIVEHKKLYKLRNTYISNFIEETDNNFMHPMFNLNTVSTFRSSSSNPNFQNIPNRDELAQKITRRGLIPRPGRQLLEVDYSGIEVRISACYHKDPAMINYITDPSTDMHRDMAREIFMKDNISKQERYLAKNKFVFPQFYGDYFKSCATAIWQEPEAKGLPFKTYDKFEKHMQQVEDRFWNERFQVYNQWKKDTWKRYEKTGEIYFHTGFVCREVLRKNEALNRAIQGTAFHCLLWSLIKVNKYLLSKKMNSCIVGQIHDSMILDVVPEELEELKPAIKKIMCEDIRKEWSWIIVPLDVEAELTDIDCSWYTKQKVEL